MKAIFFDKYGNVVWECTSNAQYEINNGTKAIKTHKATSGKLLDNHNKVIDVVSYNQAI